MVRAKTLTQFTLSIGICVQLEKRYPASHQGESRGNQPSIAIHDCAIGLVVRVHQHSNDRAETSLGARRRSSPASTSNAAAAAAQPATADSASVTPSAATQVATSTQAAVTAAESWLALVDSAQYPESWQAAAQVFQKGISMDGWSTAAGKARTPLGKLRTRQLRSAAYATSLPGVPEGKYVVIQYNAAFENSPHAIETITPMQADDGSWKVAGYFIK
jgi:hypothetical protein